MAKVTVDIAKKDRSLTWDTVKQLPPGSVVRIKGDGFDDSGMIVILSDGVALYVSSTFAGLADHATRQGKNYQLCDSSEPVTITFRN